MTAAPLIIATAFFTASIIANDRVIRRTALCAGWLIIAAYVVLKEIAAHT